MVINHKVGWHVGNENIPFGKGQKSVVRAVPPAALTFITGEGFQPDHMRWVLNEINPDCHFFFRPYFVPSNKPLDYQNYLNAVESLIDQPTWDFIPVPQRHLQIFNEQNMPRFSQWEGFGTTVDDMKRFDDIFCRGYDQLKAANKTFKIGWTPLTPGNRDVFFRVDDQNAPYYMHGPEAAKLNPTTEDIQRAIRFGPCYNSLMKADEYLAHIYIVNDAENQIYQPWGGMRWHEYEKYLPKPMDIWLPELGIQHGSWGAYFNLLNRYPQVKGTSIWRLGHEIKSAGNPAVQEIKRYLEGSPPTPEPAPPVLSIEEQIRDSAWHRVDVRYNPDAAFALYARLEQLGAPLADEYDETIDDVAFRIQPFVGGVVVAEVGQWDKVSHLEW